MLVEIIRPFPENTDDPYLRAMVEISEPRYTITNLRVATYQWEGETNYCFQSALDDEKGTWIHCGQDSVPALICKQPQKYYKIIGAYCGAVIGVTTEVGIEDVREEEPDATLVEITKEEYEDFVKNN